MSRYPLFSCAKPLKTCPTRTMMSGDFWLVHFMFLRQLNGFTNTYYKRWFVSRVMALLARPSLPVLIGTFGTLHQAYATERNQKSSADQPSNTSCECSFIRLLSCLLLIRHNNINVGFLTKNAASLSNFFSHCFHNIRRIKRILKECLAILLWFSYYLHYLIFQRRSMEVGY